MFNCDERLPIYSIFVISVCRYVCFSVVNFNLRYNFEPWKKTASYLVDVYFLTKLLRMAHMSLHGPLTLTMTVSLKKYFRSSLPKGHIVLQTHLGSSCVKGAYIDQFRSSISTICIHVGITYCLFTFCNY